ncbi:MAG: DUF1800 family protein [Deltaproteobacteria bacterium]|nr:DUF1800 family protein [Deltaproteobacteria bacterium]
MAVVCSYLRNILILVGIVLSFGAPAQAVPAKVLVEPGDKYLITIGKKFNKQPVTCRQRSGKKFDAGFLSEKNGQTFWNNISKWTSNSKNKKKFKPLAWKKLLTQQEKAIKACSKVVSTCHPVAHSGSLSITESQVTSFPVPVTDPCQLPLELRLVNSPLYGSVEINNSQMIYTPDPHSLSNDSVTFKVWNGFFESNEATYQFELHQLRTDFAGDPNYLGPYRDTLTRKEVMSVLKRLAFGGDATLRAIRSRSELVEALLNDTETAEMEQRFQAYNEARMQRSQGPDGNNNSRWFNSDIQILAALYMQFGRPFRTWMGLNFWNNHLANDIIALSNSDIHYQMVDHLHVMLDNAFGNYRTFLYKLFRESPFHTYLDNFKNTIFEPNQNFAREFLELFTVGIKDPITLVPNYGEPEVVAATRYLSGWGNDGEVLGYSNTNGLTPAAPIGFIASKSDYGYADDSTDCKNHHQKVNLRWNYQLGTTGFKLYRSPHGANTFSQVGTTIPSWTNTTNDSYSCNPSSGPQELQVYDYKLTALGPTGIEGPASAVDWGYWGEVSGSNYPAPANIDASGGEYPNKVVISWDPPAGSYSGLVGYRIYRGSEDGYRFPMPISGVLPSSQHSFEDLDVVANEQHFYFVRSVWDNGFLSARNYPSGQVGDDTGSVYGFAAATPTDLRSPLGLKASQGTSASSISLSWKAVPGAVGYQLYRGPPWQALKLKLGPLLSANTLSYVDTSVAPGMGYHYAVRALDGNGVLSPAMYGAVFKPSEWNAGNTLQDPKPFLTNLQPGDPNFSAQILGEVKDGKPEGEVLSAWGDGLEGQPVPSFVDHVLFNWPATSRNIGAQIFSEVVHRHINDDIVKEVSADLLSSQYDIKSLLRKLLNSSANFSPQANGDCVANPSEVLFKFLRFAGIPNNTSGARWEVVKRMVSVGHNIMSPPNVFAFSSNCGLVRGGIISDGSGWTTSTQTYVALGNAISWIITANSWQNELSVLPFFVPSSVKTATDLVTHIAEMLDVSLNPQEQAILVNYLNTPEAEDWSLPNSQVWRKQQKVVGLVRLMAMTIDFLKK